MASKAVFPARFSSNGRFAAASLLVWENINPRFRQPARHCGKRLDNAAVSIDWTRPHASDRPRTPPSIECRASCLDKTSVMNRCHDNERIMMMMFAVVAVACLLVIIMFVIVIVCLTDNGGSKVLHQNLDDRQGKHLTRQGKILQNGGTRRLSRFQCK